MGTSSSLDDTLIFADYDTCDHKQDGYMVQNGEKFYSGFAGGIGGNVKEKVRHMLTIFIACTKLCVLFLKKA